MIAGLHMLAQRALDAEHRGRVLVRLGRDAIVAGQHHLAGAVVEVPVAEFQRLVTTAAAVPAGPQHTPAGGKVTARSRAEVDLHDVRRRALAAAPPRRPRQWRHPA
jgi:hypothetical protein